MNVRNQEQDGEIYCEEEQIMCLLREVTVSYTHLDVYKRQSLKLDLYICYTKT